jgi:hypothetical protein
MILLYLLITYAVHPAMSQQSFTSPLSILPIPNSPLQQNLATQVPPIPPISPLNAPTSTPPSNFDVFTPTPQPTRITNPTPVVINRAEGWLKEFTFTFFVERADGRQEIYFVPIAEVPLINSDTDRFAYETYRQTLLQLAPGDRLVYECASPSMFIVPEEFQCFGRKRVTLNTPP